MNLEPNCHPSTTWWTWVAGRRTALAEHGSTMIYLVQRQSGKYVAYLDDHPTQFIYPSISISQRYHKKIFPQILQIFFWCQHFFPWLSMKICWGIGWGTPWNLALNPQKKVWKMTSGVHLRCLKSYFVLLNQMISNVHCPWSNCLLLKIPSNCCLKSNHVCLVPHFCLRSMSIWSPYYYHHMITILSIW